VSLSRKKLQEHCTSVNVTKKLRSADSVQGDLGKGFDGRAITFLLPGLPRDSVRQMALARKSRSGQIPVASQL